MALQVHPIRTPIYEAHQDLTNFVIRAFEQLPVEENSILVITSKIVSLAEGALAPRHGTDKRQLVERECDLYLGEIGHGTHLTIKHDLLIASAGIDESNSQSGDFILFPKDPFASAENLRRKLQQHFGLKRFGVLITDSHTSPLRRGVTGVCLSYSGFLALKSLVGQPDLFGRELKMTQMNLADGLAAAAVMMMGEGAESQPLAYITGAPVEFSDLSDRRQISIPLEEDLYYPLLKTFLNPQG